MKVIFSLILVSLMASSNAFAAAILHCAAEDGTTIRAVESGDGNPVLFDFRISIRGGEEVEYPNANYHLLEEDENGRVTSLVVTDINEGILVVVKDDTLIDRTGVYEVLTCEISY